MIRILEQACWIALFLSVGCARSERDGVPLREAFDITITISTNSITIGDPLHARVHIAVPRDMTVQFPPVDSAWVVRDQQEQRRVLSDELDLIDVTYQLTSFSTGGFQLFTNQIQIIDANGLEQTRSVPEHFVHIRSLLGEQDDVRPLRPVMDWPGRIPRWIPVFAGVALAALVLAWLVQHLLNKPRTWTQAAPPPPPHQVALNALAFLWSKGWIEEALIEPFFVELSTITRTYIEHRFGLRAPEQTTEEFIREATQSNLLATAHQELVARFLEQCDLVKFAKYRPDADTMRAAFAAAERLVRDTAPTTEGAS